MAAAPDKDKTSQAAQPASLSANPYAALTKPDASAATSQASATPSPAAAAPVTKAAPTGPTGSSNTPAPPLTGATTAQAPAPVAKTAPQPTPTKAAPQPVETKTAAPAPAPPSPPGGGTQPVGSNNSGNQTPGGATGPTGTANATNGTNTGQTQLAGTSQSMPPSQSAPPGSGQETSDRAGPTVLTKAPDPNHAAVNDYTLAKPTAPAAPTSTGFINFDQLYGANSGVAKRESDARANAAMAQAKKAYQELTQLQQQFAQQTQVGGGPTQDEQDWAQYGSTGVDGGPRTEGQTDPTAQTGNAVGDNGQTQAGSETQAGSGLQTDVRYNPDGSLMAPSGYDANGSPIYPGETASTDNPTTAADLQAKVQAGANAQYGGPNSLSDLDAYGKLTQDAYGAQDLANALGSNAGLQATGLGATDAALLGAAGRSRFAGLGQQYGKLGSSVDQANIQSVDQANAARDQTTADQAAYQKLLDQYSGRQSDDQATADANAAHNQQTAAAAAKRAQDLANFNSYLHGDAGDSARNTLHDIGKAVSPSEAVTGDAGLVNAGTNTLSPMSSTNRGNEWDGWANDQRAGKDDSGVWASMSQSDWNEFAGLSDEGKHEWIEKRRNELGGS